MDHENNTERSINCYNLKCLNHSFSKTTNTRFESQVNDDPAEWINNETIDVLLQ